MTRDAVKRSSLSELGFIHQFIPASTRPDQVTLFLLNGTGGNEQDLIPLGQELYLRAAILSPRGKVLESGMPRFFRRLAEGVFDIEDKFRTHELADFVRKASKVYKFDLRYIISSFYVVLYTSARYMVSRYAMLINDASQVI